MHALNTSFPHCAFPLRIIGWIPEQHSIGEDACQIFNMLIGVSEARFQGLKFFKLRQGASSTRIVGWSLCWSVGLSVGRSVRYKKCQKIEFEAEVEVEV